MKQIVKTKALVLSKLDFGDTSKIVTFYTEKFGKVSGILKGGRTQKSAFGKIADVLNLVEIVFYKKDNREIQTVTQAGLVAHYPNIKSDLEKMKYASAVAELTLKLTIENDPHPRLFSGIIKILQRLNNEQTEPMLLFALFYKFFIEEIGYGIEAEHCSQCNAQLKNFQQVFYNYELGFMCNDCGKDHIISHKFSSELIGKIICLSRREKKCLYNNDELKNIISFFEKFMIYQIDEFKGLKSLQIY